MKKIDGTTRVCGLMGNPVKHTLSPLIHNTLAEDMGQDLIYTAFEVETEAVGDAVKGAYALNLLGMNVTVPHKSAVLPYLKEVDELAAKIGAVNTLVRCAGGYKGYNTDMTGLLRAMKSDGVTLKGEHVILLGAGGAARAVAFLCVQEGAERVYLLNRSQKRAEEVAKEVNEAFGKEAVTAMLLTQHHQIPGYADSSGKKYLAIQGTSVGLSPDTQAAVLYDSDFYQKIHTGYDLIYRPYETRFMRLVQEHGGRAFNGLKMLAYQAIHAYELWNQVSVGEEEADRIIQKLKEEMKIYG